MPHCTFNGISSPPNLDKLQFDWLVMAIIGGDLGDPPDSFHLTLLAFSAAEPPGSSSAHICTDIEMSRAALTRVGGARFIHALPGACFVNPS